MGGCVVKVDQDPEDERYLYWSTNTNGFTWCADSREVARALLFDDDDRKSDRIQEFDPSHPENRLKRADERGSSSMMGDWRFDDDEGCIYKQDGFLLRKHLPVVYERMVIAEENAPPDQEYYEDPDLSDLLVPLED